MAWSFHIGFRLAAGHRIIGLQEPAVIREGPPEIALHGLGRADRTDEREQVAPGTSILVMSNRPQHCALSGSGYLDETSAVQDGLRWFDALRVHFVGFRHPVDFGDPEPDRTATTIPDSDGPGFQRLPLGLSVGKSDRTSRLSPDSPDQTGSFLPANQLASLISEVFDRGYTLTHSQRTAAAIFSAALSIADPEARFVMLISSIEHVLERPERSESERAVLDDMRNVIKSSSLDKSAKASLLGSTGDLKKISIKRAGAQLVSDINGFPGEREDPSKPRDPVKYWNECYDLRSTIAHGPHRKPYSTAEVRRMLYGLDIFAALVLWRAFHKKR